MAVDSIVAVAVAPVAAAVVAAAVVAVVVDDSVLFCFTAVLPCFAAVGTPQNSVKKEIFC